jgi:DNA-binding PadR family transcriptional regulator
MWLNRIRLNKKSLSPVEFLVLSLIPDHEIDAKTLMTRLNNSFNYWKAERGTIYPILHRMNSIGLIDVSDSGKMMFKRSNLGTHLILTQISSIKEQIETNFEFVHILLDSMLEIDPFVFKELKSFYKGQLNRFLQQLEKLDEKETGDWQEVKVD